MLCSKGGNMFFIVKVVVTALIVAGVSELSKRFPFFAAVIISLPMVSILTFVWIYVETRDAQKLIGMSREIFWLVLPSLLFFVALPVLLSRGVPFVWSLLVACAVMSAGYVCYAWLLGRLGIHL